MSGRSVLRYMDRELPRAEQALLGARPTSTASLLWPLSAKVGLLILC